MRRRAVAPSCRLRWPGDMITLVLIACLATATASTTNETIVSNVANSTKEILSASETADPKVEIVKQIRRLNEDGSYTIGYEADDGTFKIESRDVRGNVKGTFGYIDQDGEIKRVTYSSSGETTPIPVTTTTTQSPPTAVVKVNRTVSSTTRRPLATVVYPTRSSIRESATRGTVIQSIPRRRLVTTSARATTSLETTTEKQNVEETTSNIINLYKARDRDQTKTRTQISKPISATVKEDLTTKETTTNLPQTIKPVHENVEEDETEASKANTKRRELPGTSPNPHMMTLQQSAGDDSTDVYGSHQSLGSVRPLFTTTTSRPRLIPIHTLIAARQKIPRFQDPIQEQETTVEASTGRVFDQQRVVTTNPVPVVHIQPHRDVDERFYQQPIYRRPQATVQFRTDEYMRDNPGAPIPIGNQRPFLQYDYPDKILEQQFIKEASTGQQTKATVETATVPYEVRPTPRFIPIPVDERGVPLQGYQARFVNPYRPVPTPVYQQRYDPLEEMHSISAPVSTRDLKRLLQILILRQNRLQALMDQIVSPAPPYQASSMYRQDYDYNRHPMSRYVDEDRFDYRYDQQYRQEPYQNQMSFDNNQYESQRYVPRRRYQRPYDAAGSSSNNIEETPEYLPPEIREALLLKMLMLAINPDYMPTPAPSTELTTAAPTRKQVRNVQILGEEGTQVKSVQRQ